ncbi:MAG: hypothetical protein H6872_09490 [Methylobacteriaceae bacterium]|nr:hypothetical protein [Rhodoblastus sp.]MCC0005358.1 hypothetical protein [Methylobacteriaceae bacterium]
MTDASAHPAPLDWRAALSEGAVACRVSQDGAPPAEWAPTKIDDLWAPIRMHETGGVARGEFVGAYRDFVESGAGAGRHEGEACETIVKFGRAIQFRQAFVVRFTRLDLASRASPP